jgi:ATP-dependent helicase/nuclease subunit A
MTIHKAKGLEFPAVALPALSTSFNFKKSKLLFHQQFGIVLNTSRTEQESEEGLPLPYQLGKTLDDDMDIAEKKRLLYVAMTRARDHLALFIKEGNDNKKSIANWLRPLLTENSHAKFTIHKADLEPALSETSERLGRSGGSTITESTVAESAPLFSPVANDKAQQLLEPTAAHLGTRLMPLPEASPLVYRISPSPAKQAENSGLKVNTENSARSDTPARHTADSARSDTGARQAEPNAVLTGKFFHKIMEYLAKDKSKLEDDELEALVEQFGEEVAHPLVKQALIAEGKKLINIYAGSKMRELISAAKTVCHEWSYYINSETLRLNRPDLLLETANGNWYLIDYKTDRFQAGDLEQHIARHRPQLQRYGEDFSKLTNIQPQLAIYFAQYGTLHEWQPISSGQCLLDAQKYN